MMLVEKPVAELWYGVQSFDKDIVRLREIYLDAYAVGDIWIVRGSKQAVALDCGSGIVPPGPMVKTLANKPVFAIALNSGYDHAGGWSSFEHRACHPGDVPVLEYPTTDDAGVFDYLTDEMFYALPRAGFKARDYLRRGAAPTRLLEDREIIDLGDRTLQVLHTPGRSPGGLSVWERTTGTLFSSEILYDGDHGLAWPPDDSASYRESLRRLSKLPVNRVLAGHYSPFDGTRMRTLIKEQLADLESR